MRRLRARAAASSRLGGVGSGLPASRRQRSVACIAVFASFGTQPALTTGPNDADPVFAPDLKHVAFRRLTDATANGGLGSWDIVTVATDGTGAPGDRETAPRTAAGPPDWEARAACAWAEADAAKPRGSWFVSGIEAPDRGGRGAR